MGQNTVTCCSLLENCQWIQHDNDPRLTAKMTRQCQLRMSKRVLSIIPQNAILGFLKNFQICKITIFVSEVSGKEPFKPCKSLPMFSEEPLTCITYILWGFCIFMKGSLHSQRAFSYILNSALKRVPSLPHFYCYMINKWSVESVEAVVSPISGPSAQFQFDCLKGEFIDHFLQNNKHFKHSLSCIPCFFHVWWQ